MIAWLWDCLSDLLAGLAKQIAVFIVYRKRISNEKPFKRIFYMCMFPLFDVIGKWSSYIALFKKVEWKAIPHERVVDIDTLDKK